MKTKSSFYFQPDLISSADSDCKTSMVYRPRNVKIMPAWNLKVGAWAAKTSSCLEHSPSPLPLRNMYWKPQLEAYRPSLLIWTD